MKKLLSFLGRPPVLLLLTLFLLLLLGYFGWDLFFSGTRREPLLFVAVALAGFIAVAVSAIPGYLRERKRRSPTEGPVAAELNQALDAMAEGNLRRKDRIYRMPWVLVLGPSGSGKAAALAQASFARRIAPPGARDPLCALWQVQARDGVLLQPQARLQESSDMWSALLRWLQRQRPVDAVLLQVAAPQLLGPGVDLGVLGGQLAGRLRDVGQRVRPDVPVVLMVSQCDRVDGFLRFFAGLTPRERDAAWGFVLDLRDGEMVSTAVDEQIGGESSTERALVTPLWQRAHEAFRSALKAEERAAVLGFPKEVARLGKALGVFLDALYPRGMGGGAPRLVEICFTSTQQGGIPVAGARHEFWARGQTVRARPAPEPMPQVGAFFLRGALQRTMDRAAAVSRPPLRWHTLALGAALFLCIAGGWMLGRNFAGNARWLARVSEEIQLLSSPLQLDTSADFGLKLLPELVVEGRLAVLLRDQKYEDRASGPTRAVHHGALRFLRCRAGSQLVAPVVDYTTSTQAGANRLYANLKKAAKGRGQNFYETFAALKTAELLKKGFLPDRSKVACPPPTEADKDELASYLTSLWGLDLEDQAPKMQAGIRTFVDLYLAAKDEELWPLFQLDGDSLRNAQTSLKTIFQGRQPAEGEGENAKGVAEMYFHMRTQRDKTKSIFQGEHKLQEPGIAPVFTSVGCPALFKKDDKWGAWLACVRGELVEGAAPANELRLYYLDVHKKAWSTWMAQLKYGGFPHDNPVQAADMLRGLSRDLTYAFKLVGRGSLPGKEAKEKAGKDTGQDADKALGKAAGEKAVAVKKAYDTLAADREGGGNTRPPEACVTAQEELAIFPFAAGDEKIEFDDQGANVAEAYKAYQQALDEVSKAMVALAEWKTEDFQPYQGARVAASALSVRRDSLVKALGDQGQHIKGLLDRIEIDVQKTLHAALRTFLAEQWRRLLEEWKPKAHADADEVRKFLDERFAGFVTKFIDTLDPGTSAQVICSGARQTIDAIRGLRAPAAPPPAAPPPPAAAPPPSYRTPRITVAGEGCQQPQTVVVETLDKGRFKCEPSPHTCVEQKAAAAPAKEAMVRAYFQDPTKPTRDVVIARAATFADLIKNRRRNERQDGLEAVVFTGPERCTTKIYLDPAMLDAGRPPPGKPTLKVILPPKLTCP